MVIAFLILNALFISKGVEDSGGGTSSAIQVRIKPTSVQFPSVSDIRMDVTVTNKGRESITLYDIEPQVSLYLQLYDARMHRITLPTNITVSSAIQSDWLQVLGPNEHISTVVRLREYGANPKYKGKVSLNVQYDGSAPFKIGKQFGWKDLPFAEHAESNTLTFLVEKHIVRLIN